MSSSVPPPPAIGWRLLALFYDLWPAAALWMAASAVATLWHGNQPIAAFSSGQFGLWLVCWMLTGAYAVASWRRGGQTLGMRPFRLRVTGTDGRAAPVPALLWRYVLGTLSLAAAGAGFWWAWIDRDRLTWHDRFSATRLQRFARPGAGAGRP